MSSFTSPEGRNLLGSEHDTIVGEAVRPDHGGCQDLRRRGTVGNLGREAKDAQVGLGIDFVPLVRIDEAAELHLKFRRHSTRKDILQSVEQVDLHFVIAKVFELRGPDEARGWYWRPAEGAKEKARRYRLLSGADQ